MTSSQGSPWLPLAACTLGGTSSPVPTEGTGPDHHLLLASSHVFATLPRGQDGFPQQRFPSASLTPGSLFVALSPPSCSMRTEAKQPNIHQGTATPPHAERGAGVKREATTSNSSQPCFPANGHPFPESLAMSAGGISPRPPRLPGPCSTDRKPRPDARGH